MKQPGERDPFEQMQQANSDGRCSGTTSGKHYWVGGAAEVIGQVCDVCGTLRTELVRNGSRPWLDDAYGDTDQTTDYWCPRTRRVHDWVPSLAGGADRCSDCGHERAQSQA